MPPGFLLNLSAPQSERFASPSVFRHFGSMKSKHPGGRVAVLCWCFTAHSRYVTVVKVLDGKQPNGWTPATGTRCNAAGGRRHNDWIIEEFSAWMWHCCVSQRCCWEMTASIKLRDAAGHWSCQVHRFEMWRPHKGKWEVGWLKMLWRLQHCDQTKDYFWRQRIWSFKYLNC